MEHSRKILHVDMDAFYASVEIRDDPNLQGKPVIVGGSLKGRGVVLTCSYEARKFGIHSGMGSSKADILCPHATWIPPRFKVYVEISKQIRNIFYEYTDLVEMVSLDEAYLDVTYNKKGLNSAETVAADILKNIKNKTGLTASAGVSFNKFLAKVGSDFNKPNGLTVINEVQAPSFIDKLTIGKFIGVGKVTEKKMKKYGIYTGADLKKFHKDALKKMFGKQGSYFYYMAQGLDNRRVGSYHNRKSIGKERTLSRDLVDPDTLIEILDDIAVKLTERMKKRKFKGRTITLRIKYYNFHRITRSITCKEPVDDPNVIMANIKRLIIKTDIGKKEIRLVGIALSNLTKYEQGSIQQITLERQVTEVDKIKL
jgi:DNA polymerase-4